MIEALVRVGAGCVAAAQVGAAAVVALGWPAVPPGERAGVTVALLTGAAVVGALGWLRAT